MVAGTDGVFGDTFLFEAHGRSPFGLPEDGLAFGIHHVERYEGVRIAVIEGHYVTFDGDLLLFVVRGGEGVVGPGGDGWEHASGADEGSDSGAVHEPHFVMKSDCRK